MVKHRKLKSIISYRILATKRSEGGSARMRIYSAICHNVRYVSRGRMGDTRALAGAHSEET